MPITHIPQEVTDLIIYEVSLLDESPIKALKACSLTCKSFSSQAQKRIFYTIKLYYEPPSYSKKETVYQRFYNAISCSPALADNVRVLEVDCVNWILSKYPTFPQVLKMLRTLQTCSLSFEKNKAWNDLDTDLRQAITEVMLRSPGVEYLDITGLINLPTAVAEWLCAIPCVRIEYVTFEDSVDIDSMATTSATRSYPCRIKNLEIAHEEYSKIRPLISILSSSECALEKLLVKLSEYEDLKVAQEIILVAPSLTSLEHPYPFDRKGVLSPVSLHTLSSLKTLQIDISSTSGIQGTQKMLETLPGTNSLQMLKLKLTIWDIPCWISGERDRGLHDLDVALSGEKFRTMKKVVVLVNSFMVEDLDDHDREAFPARVKENFGGLFRSGKLCVEDIPYEWDNHRDDMIQFY